MFQRVVCKKRVRPLCPRIGRRSTSRPWVNTSSFSAWKLRRCIGSTKTRGFCLSKPVVTLNFVVKVQGKLPHVHLSIFSVRLVLPLWRGPATAVPPALFVSAASRSLSFCIFCFKGLSSSTFDPCLGSQGF